MKNFLFRYLGLLMAALIAVNALLCLSASAVETPEMARLWQRWREMRYSLYPKVEALTPDFSPREFDRIWFRPEFTTPVRRFHQQYAADIRAYRSALLTAYNSPAPDLAGYTAFELDGLNLVWQERGYGEMLGLQFLHPFEVVEFLQNLLLSRVMPAQELGLFYLRRSQGQTRYSAQDLAEGHWRLWADSYYFVLALDLDLAANTVQVHGLWERESS